SCWGTDGNAFFNSLFVGPPKSVPRIVEDFDPLNYFDPKEARRIDRFAQFAVAAAHEALTRAGISPDFRDDGINLPSYIDPERAGVVIATGIGGLATLEAQIIINENKGPRRVSPFLVPMMMPNAAAAAVSMRFGWQGPCETATTACAAGTQAIGNAARLVASGRCDIVLAGGSESSLTPTAIAAFGNMTALSTSGVSKPFDKSRDGFIMAEGAGVLVLESRKSAMARGATILAQIKGASSGADAHHITAPAPGGRGAIACMSRAISDAGMTTSDIGQINAHGTSTPLNDLAEAQAIAKLFGENAPPVTSIKGVTGHALGAAGALEAVASVLSIRNRVIPPTMGLENVDEEISIEIVVDKNRTWEPKAILSNSFGFGGHNGCLVITPDEI
ncbi:MAG: beta-ketoacyl-ACP synthase II, partial [Acidimicrobiales bacterium]|nr:beta-ketoacyl-ACP synthase II [Acidimicrobiales bacterium]